MPLIGRITIGWLGRSPPLLLDIIHMRNLRSTYSKALNVVIVVDDKIESEESDLRMS
jgi:hypothetical protein